MEDFRFLFWIVIAIIYVVRFVIKQGKGKKPVGQGQVPDRQGRPKRQPTFEELLQEFTEKKTAKPTALEIEEDRKQTEPSFSTAYDDSKSKLTYEESIVAARKKNALKENNYKTPSTHFAKYKIEEETAESKIAELLSSPENVKNAVILSEIINRRY